MNDQMPLQDRIHPDSRIRGCFGCGADNTHGMRIKSFLVGDEGVSTWKALEHHCSYPCFLNGGILCTIMDCHSAWTAFAVECRDNSRDMETELDLPVGWTRAMNVEFLKPIPIDSEIVLKANVIKKGRTSRTVACCALINDELCAKAEVTMVMSG